MSSDAPGLRRSLSLVDLVALGLNCVIGTGIFFMPGYVAAELGPAAVWSFLVSAVLCSLIVLCYAEVGSRFRGTGGAILYSRAAFGPLVGFGVGWLAWIARLASWGALSNALVDALGALAPGALGYRPLVITGLFAILVAVNVAGVRQAALMTNAVTVAKLAPMVLFVGFGLFHLDGSLFEPFAPHGYSALGSATLVILWAFVGFEAMVVPAGEAVNPTVHVPRALLAVMATVTTLYLAVWLVCAGTLPTLAASTTPVSDAAAQFLGPLGTAVINLGIVLSVVGVNSASALVTPRYLLALAESGSVPGVLGWLHAGRRTPVVAILVSATAAWLLALSGSFVELAVLSVVARFGEYIPTCLALPRLRAKWPERPPAYRAPFGPVLALLAVSLCLWLLAQAELRQIVAAAMAVALGLLIHLPTRLRSRSAAAAAGSGRPIP